MADRTAFADETEFAPDDTAEAGWMKALDRLARGLLFALPILFVVGRAPAEIAFSLIAVLFLARSGLGLGWSWLKTPWVTAAIVFWAFLLLASAFALSPEDSYGRALPFLRFILFAAALQHWLLTDPKAVGAFLKVLAAAVAFVIVDCLYQYATGVDIFGKTAEGAFRLSGPFSNDVAGTFLAKVSLPLLGWWFAFAAQRGHLSWSVGGLLALVIGVVILLTGERTALVSYAMGVGLLVMAVRSLRRPLLLVGLVAAIGIGTLIVNQGELRQRFVGHTTADVQDFWNNRYGIIFVHAIDAWKEAPVTGVGLRNFRLTCETGNFDHRGEIASWCFTHAHNPYLELLSETGAVGLLLFLVMIVLILKEVAAGWRLERPDFPLVAASAASLLMFLWPVMVSKSLFANWNAMLFWLAIGLALAVAFPRSPQSARMTT
ncbi:MAG: O-antigen ligase family protein [Geminicoccaceae bacterium]